MKQEQSIAMFHYWNRLRGRRPAPMRAEIEPAEIKSLLADTFILERDQRGEAVFRLAGTRLCAIYGRELKGYAFASLWQEKDHKMVARLTGGAFNAKSVLVMSFVGLSQAGRENPFELLLLPLDGGVDNPRCLGVLSGAERPYWLGADPITDAKIDAVRSLDPDRDPVLADPEGGTPPARPSSTATLTRGEPNGGRRIGHLLVLNGGRGGGRSAG